MLIKLTGHRTDRPVLIETDDIVTAEESEDTFRDGKKYTALLVVRDSARTSIGVKETCDEILEQIKDNEDGLL